LPSLHHLRK